MKNQASHIGSGIVILSGLLALSGQHPVHAADRSDGLHSTIGAVFSDVDQSGDRWDSDATTSVLFYGVYHNLLFRADVPASKGDGSRSLDGVLNKARISLVRIRAGDVDDFIFGDPQAIAQRDSQAAALPEMD